MLMTVAARPLLVMAPRAATVQEGAICKGGDHRGGVEKGGDAARDTDEAEEGDGEGGRAGISMFGMTGVSRGREMKMGNTQLGEA